MAATTVLSAREGRLAVCSSPVAACAPIKVCRTRTSKVKAQPAKAAAQQTASESDIKDKLRSLAGTKNGLDRTPEQQTDINGTVEDLLASTSSSNHKLDLKGTAWTLQYTDSTSQSAGKLGPLIGYVEQEFPSSKPGTYVNRVDFGLLKVKLSAAYDYASDSKINVNFTEIAFKLGPFQWSKEFAGAGHWMLRYTASDLRVLVSNQAHVFVLQRVQQPKLLF